LFDVDDIVKLSSSEEAEEDVLRIWLWVGSGRFTGKKLESGITGDRGARFFCLLLVRGARIRVGYMRW
jgi:hypothetical protein